MVNRAYAHSLAGKPRAEWEPLARHLEEVGRSAASFAQAFGAAPWGEALGRCHDLGKASAAFQARIGAGEEDAGVERPGRVDHSTFGARFCSGRLAGAAGELLAYAIAGHHAGLPDAAAEDASAERGTLRYRLDPRRCAIPSAPEPELALEALALPFRLEKKSGAFSLAFFTRMLFSCLVDADRTCTEAFCEPESARERAAVRPSLAELRQRLEAHLEELQAVAESLPVNRIRREVLDQCLAAAAQPPGFFSLQVPTGGGKTLSSLAFALEHAEGRCRRVIMAIPFTSIVEQTADVYRSALRSLAARGLLEHHSNVQGERETRAGQMAAENWDAPLVVTTNVQLFESLFAAAAAPCRKLHRLAGSVIILDEAQTLPVELLAPTLAALRELVDHYGCTVVLCTATQPALSRRDEFPLGLENVRPIIAEPVPLFAALRRVEVRRAGKLTDDELADRLAREPKALAIVNTRVHAAGLYARLVELVGPDSCFHLSTLMCGAHRRIVLSEIRERVRSGACRVVSTQLIEAGVDLDFPVVYRAEAGFDAIAQAAGRCNREGRLPGLGVTHVFEAEQLPPPGFLRSTAESARELWGRHPDPLAPEAVEAYFRHHYWRHADVLDKENVLTLMEMDWTRGKTRFQFREIAERYRIIRDAQAQVLIAFDSKAREYWRALDAGWQPFVPQRLLQAYLVGIPERNARALEAEGALRKHESGVWLLLRDDAYDARQGLKLGELGLDERAWFA